MIFFAGFYIIILNKRKGNTKNKMVTIQGEVEEIIYRNEMNGYTVCSIVSDGNITTVIGHMLSLNAGETIKVTGKWTTHPSYGEQFKAELCERQLPRTGNSMVRFLGSGIIKGVREATAKKIIDKFGEETVEILSNSPHRLSEIKGISIEKALAIGQAFNEYDRKWDISVFLQQYGISPLFVNKIYKQFGDKSVEAIKENPYRLVDEIPGIGFKTADNIALAMGIDPASENRIASCITHILIKAAVDQGHTFLTADKVREYVSDLLGVAGIQVQNAIITLAVGGKIVLEKSLDSENLYIRSLNQAETGVARKLLDLSFVNFENTGSDLVGCIPEIEEEQKMILADDQKQAVLEALQNGVTVITGGPGTGKTTIIKTIVHLLERMGLSYVLAAPTGRAAKRLSEATEREAKTIHRLLEMGHGESSEADMLQISRNVQILNEDVVIIDELSMVDIILMNHLLKSIVNGTRLILVGDADQLPAVGPGNVLKDIIASGVIKVVRLTEIFRQAGESLIVVNAHRINKGEYPVFNSADGDFFILRTDMLFKSLKGIISLCSERLPKNKGYDPFRDIQVLSPTKKGMVGVKNLNVELQKVLNPESEEKSQKTFAATTFRQGDKVMQIKNNYDLAWRRTGGYQDVGFGVFNGDIGKIVSIDDDNDVITVLYDDREVDYTQDIFDEIDLAYAATVHKSQGSEFPVVIMPVFSGLPMLTSRNLLYTAITRAREMLILVGSEEDVRFMTDNYREERRNSGLADKLNSLVGMPVDDFI